MDEKFAAMAKCRKDLNPNLLANEKRDRFLVFSLTRKINQGEK